MRREPDALAGLGVRRHRHEHRENGAQSEEDVGEMEIAFHGEVPFFAAGPFLPLRRSTIARACTGGCALQHANCMKLERSRIRSEIPGKAPFSGASG